MTWQNKGLGIRDKRTPTYNQIIREDQQQNPIFLVKSTLNEIKGNISKKRKQSREERKKRNSVSKTGETVGWQQDPWKGRKAMEEGKGKGVPAGLALGPYLIRIGRCHLRRGCACGFEGRPHREGERMRLKRGEIGRHLRSSRMRPVRKILWVYPRLMG